MQPNPQGGQHNMVILVQLMDWRQQGPIDGPSTTPTSEASSAHTALNEIMNDTWFKSLLVASELSERSFRTTYGYAAWNVLKFSSAATASPTNRKGREIINVWKTVIMKTEIFGKKQGIMCWTSLVSQFQLNKLTFQRSKWPEYQCVVRRHTEVIFKCHRPDFSKHLKDVCISKKVQKQCEKNVISYAT